MGQYEKESYERFRQIVPKNPIEWEGSIVVYAVELGSFFRIAFGTGDNLSADDLDDGCDDYIMVDQFALSENADLEDILREIKKERSLDEGVDGIVEVDGGQLLLRRKEWSSGDIRRFIETALEFSGYGVVELENWMKDVIFVCSDWEDE